MEIFVKQMGSKNADRLQFRLEPSENIGSLRKQIAEKLAISEDCIKLIHKGHFLKDGMDIENCGLSDGSVVHMMKSKGQVLPHTADDSPENAGSQQTEEQLRQAGGSQRKVTTNIPVIDNLMERLGPGNRVERMMDANPEIIALLKNPEQMQEMMNIAINPELRLEYMRNMDRALSNIEAIPGGYNALASMMMSDVSEAPESSEGISNERQNSKNPFLRLFKQTGSVNENPIPNPWRSPSAPTVSARPSIRSEEEIISVVERLFSEERVGDLISAMEDPNRRLRALESTSEDSERVILESTLTAG
eukprot:jgi/Picre1/29634/NNA_005017.t1